MQSQEKEVERKTDLQRNSPGQKNIPPRLPRPEDSDADGNREPKARDECLAHAVEDYSPWEVGNPVQGSGVRDEKHADEDVAGDKRSEVWSWRLGGTIRRKIPVSMEVWE
ncbi:hypothetical protein MBLNU13_g04494t1 [Cladosporium sp. NU13]